MKYSLFSRTAALLCALCLLLAPLEVCAEDGQVVTIRSLADFQAFAQNCVSDIWSQGITVELTADLDLSQIAFTPIPIFQGTFHGNGHTISGINWSGQGSKYGLFRTLTGSALVEDLHVEGTLSPGGSAAAAGLLAGENSGTITGCTASGSVTALAQGGGLVGQNSGTISRCRSSVCVQAVTSAGGIAGENSGTISECTNSGPINPSGDMDVPSDAGGIAGTNTGRITQCSNSGAVGSAHLGYNIGGIAGRHSGTISDCSNTGNISGRKDVGGIAGQFEPHITLSQGVSPAQALEDAISRLSSLMRRFVSELGTLADDAIGDVEQITQSAENLLDKAHTAGDDAIDDLSDLRDSLYRDAVHLGDLLDDLLAQVESFHGDTEDSLSNLRRALSNLQTELGSILSSADEQVQPLRNAMASLSEGAEQAEAAISAIREETRALVDYIKALCQAILNGTSLPDGPPAFDPLTHLKELRTALSQIADAGKALPGALEQALDAFPDRQDRDRLSSLVDKLRRAAGDLADTADTFLTGTEETFRQVNTTFQAVRETIYQYTLTLEEKGQALRDDMAGDVQSIRDSVNSLTQRASQGSTTLQRTANQVLDQLDAVGAAAAELSTTPELTLESCSDPLSDGPGLISGCSALGAVQGDANTGGIAGILAPELGEDPEVDVEFTLDTITADTTVQLRAVVQSCRFDGTVTVKNDCGGGIAGRCITGAVLDCAANAAVETGGDYCGGIAGRSNVPISRCAAIADLTGVSYVGGITGLAGDLTSCRAMAEISADGEWIGAIAGTGDGVLTDNRYLREKTAGVDGVELAGQAQGASWEEFSALDYIPGDFLTFSATFRADGVVIAVIPFSYGGSLSASDIPAIPEHIGDHALWPSFPTEHLTRSFTVDAIMEEPSDTLSWGDPQPVLLAIGTFDPGSALTVQPLEESAAIGRASCTAAYDYAITGSAADTVTLRIHTDAPQRSKAAILADGTWEVQDTQVEGSYLVLSAPVNGRIAVFTSPPSHLTLILSILGGAIVVALMVVYFRRRLRSASTAKT